MTTLPPGSSAAPPAGRPLQPERLDRRIRPVGRGTWVALAAIHAIVALALGWAFLGSLPTYVHAEGILLNRGTRILDVQAPGAGVLTGIAVTVGDEVQEGQLLALLVREQSRQQVANAEQALEDATAIRAELAATTAATLATRAESAARQRAALGQQIAAAEQRVEVLDQRFLDQERLRRQGIATRQTVETTREELAEARRQVAAALADLAAVDQANAEFEAQAAAERARADQAVAEARRRLAELRTAETETTRVLAPATGRITELRVTERMTVQAAQSLFGVEPAGDGLEARLYVPSRQGKLVEPGMPVRLEPATAPRAEFGALLAEMSWVAAFPATPSGMRSVLQNEELVRSFLRGGPPFSARAELLPDPGSASGYRWTSEAGRGLALSSGTPVRATVVVRRQAPVTLLLPALGAWLGLL
jgi:HlyD family secretion protein